MGQWVVDILIVVSVSENRASNVRKMVHPCLDVGQAKPLTKCLLVPLLFGEEGGKYYILF